MKISKEAVEIAAQAHSLIGQLGDAIEALVTREGCSVSLDVYFNEGSESMTLHQLNGEFLLRVFRTEEITPKEP